MPYQVTVAAGLKDVVLPNGLRAQAGDVVTLSDAEYAMLSPTARHGTTLFSAITATPVLNNENLSSQGIPMTSGYTNPLAENAVGQPDNVTTPYSITNNPNSLEIG